MKKHGMSAAPMIFKEGGDLYLQNCRQRNLREGTINHYRQSYLYFFKYFDPNMPISDLNAKAYNDYILNLKATLHNDVGINAYLRDFITTIHFFHGRRYLPYFKNEGHTVASLNPLFYLDYTIRNVQ